MDLKLHCMYTQVKDKCMTMFYMKFVDSFRIMTSNNERIIIVLVADKDKLNINSYKKTKIPNVKNQLNP